MNRSLFLWLVVALAPLGCSSSPAGTAPAAARTAPPRIDGAEARRLLGAGALLLDVRSEEEFADGHIEGARNLPVDRLGAQMATLPRDKPIIVYCAVGSRSARAAEILHSASYDVRNLGAMANWGR